MLGQDGDDLRVGVGGEGDASLGHEVLLQLRVIGDYAWERGGLIVGKETQNCLNKVEDLAVNDCFRFWNTLKNFQLEKLLQRRVANIFFQ